MDTSKPTLLVLDDEPDIVKALATYLRGALQADVLEASSGPEALKLLEGREVDLVLSDFRMPGMDGLQFLGQVRTRWPDIPRLLLTAYPDMQLAIRAVNESHVTRFLTKPVQPTELAKVVREVLAESRRQRAGQAALRRAAGTPGGGSGA